MKSISDVIIKEEREVPSPEIPRPAEVPQPPLRRAEWFRKAGRICLMAVAFLTPFLFLPLTEDAVGVNKMVIVGFLVIAAFICFLGCVFEERSVAYPRSWFSLFFLLFIVVEFVSATTSVSPIASWYGALRAPDSFAGILLCALIFFLSFFFFHHRDLLKIGMLIGGGLLIATAISLFGGFTPVGTPLAWRILLAAGIAAVGSISLRDLMPRWRIVLSVATLIALVALFIVNYPLLWLALAVFLIAVAAFRFGFKEYRFRFAFAVVVLAIFFALTGPRLPALTHLAQPAAPGAGQTFAAARSTLTGWRTLIGTGPATFPLDFSTYPPLTSGQGHDFILTLLATGGLLGCLLFLLMAAAAVLPFFRMQLLGKDLAMAAVAVTFLLAALFFAPAFFAGFAVLFMLLGIFAAEHSRKEISFVILGRWQAFLVSLAVMVLAALSLSAAYTAGMQYAAAILFEQSGQSQAAGDLNDAFKQVNAAIQLDRTDEYLRGAASVLIAEARVLAASSDPSASAQLPTVVENAIQAAQNAASISPNDPANWGNLGSVYEVIMPVATGADALAAKSYAAAAALAPADPEWDLAIGRVFMESANLLPSGASSTALQENDWSQAETFFEKAIAVKDDYADARVMLIQLYLKEGNIAQAIEKVQELTQQNPLDPGVAFELGYLYYQSNQMTQAQNEFQVATILDPNYSNALYFLGLTYDQNGMAPQALAAFERVLVLNPGNPQVKQIIANIQAGDPALANSAASSTSTLSGAAQPSQIPAPAHEKPAAKNGGK